MKCPSRLLAGLLASSLLSISPAFAQTKGGTLAVVEPAALGGAHPNARPNIQIVNARYQILDQLLQVDPDAGTVHPWLATSWAISDDGLVYEFKLRHGVTHSDGSVLDAQNVKNNLDTWVFGDEARKLPKSARLSSIEKVEAIDPLTLRVTLKHPDSLLLNYLSMPDYGIHAQSYLDLDWSGQVDFSNIVGSGPFVIKSYRDNEQLELVRREDYAWPVEGSTNAGPAYLDRVIVRFAPDATARAGLISSGQVDLARAISPVDEAFVAQSGGQILHANPRFGTAAVIYARPTNPQLADEKVRRALAVSYDPSALIRDGLSPSYNSAVSVIPKGGRGHVDYADRFAYNPDEAARLLNEAGWLVGADGIREKNGERLRLQLAVAPSSVGSTTGKRYFELLAQQWQKVGVEIDLSQIASPTFWSETSRSDSVPLSALRSPMPDGVVVLRKSVADYLGLKGQDAKLEQLLDDIVAAITPEQELAAYKAVQEHLIDNAYILPLYDDPQVYAASSRAHNVTFNSMGHPNLQQVWLD